MVPVKTAVVGCGGISDIYFQNMIGKYKNLDVISCCAKHLESAERQGKKYGINAQTYEEILQDPEIEMVVILTPADTHYELIKQGLSAGKHVFTEKPLAVDTMQGLELLKLADQKKCYLGAAPETFLGSAVQTAYKALEDGAIGKITSFHVVANRNLTMLASAVRSLRVPGGGIGYDYGVYYLTALIDLLGPAKEVFASVKNLSRVRKNVYPKSPEYGQDFIYDNESQVYAVLTLENGVTGTFALNGDSVIMDQGYFTIHGTKGILKLGDANLFGGEISVIPNDVEAFTKGSTSMVLKPVSPLMENCRGIGPAEMALAIRKGQPNYASKEMAYHVLDIVECMMESGKTKTIQTVKSTCRRPAFFNDWDQIVIEGKA